MNPFPSKRSRVRVLNDEGDRQTGRRGFLRSLAAQGASIPVAYLLMRTNGAVAAPSRARPDPAVLHPRNYPRGRIVRDFASPYLELVRLLHEAAEIEQSLMLQYLYGAFSLKPCYAEIIGSGAPVGTDLMGIAVQEMQHLGAVNRMLVALGAAPKLGQQDFPYEPDIYPFEFSLEPLTRKSLAKYLYAEAPTAIFAPAAAPADRALADEVMRLLGPRTRPNHVGSLYDAVIDRLRECAAAGMTRSLDVASWLDRLEKIKVDGETDHYGFFRSVFTGEHPALAAVGNVWSLPATHADYPSVAAPVNPTAFVGHEGEIDNPQALTLGWLGNLHYWAALFLLDLHFREGEDCYLDMARNQMLGPVWSLARHLPTIGGGMPFDVLSMGSAPGHDAVSSAQFVVEMLREAQVLADRIPALLPSDYPADTVRDTLVAVLHEVDAMQVR